MMLHLEEQPLYVRLLTNGTFPLEYCSDVIKGDRVIVNLSAANRKQYHDLQVKDLFDRVVNNIKRLVALRDSSKLASGLRLGILTMLLILIKNKKCRI